MTWDEVRGPKSYLGTFVANARVNGLIFGPDGNLYVADTNLGVVRYNGTDIP